MYSLYALLTVLTLIVVFSMWVFGLVYLYQSLVSILYSFSFLVLCINFDNEILDKCEKIGFIVRSSRKYKFYLLFACIGFFIFSVFTMSVSETDWKSEQKWIMNASNVSKTYFSSNFTYYIGLYQMQIESIQLSRH